MFRLYAARTGILHEFRLLIHHIHPYRLHLVELLDRHTNLRLIRALIDLESQFLESDGRRYTLAPGMQVMAEVNLGSRTVLEYLLSPVQKAFHEAGRER